MNIIIQGDPYKVLYITQSLTSMLKAQGSPFPGLGPTETTGSFTKIGPEHELPGWNCRTDYGVKKPGNRQPFIPGIRYHRYNSMPDHRLLFSLIGFYW